MSDTPLGAREGRFARILSAILMLMRGIAPLTPNKTDDKITGGALGVLRVVGSLDTSRDRNERGNADSRDGQTGPSEPSR